MSSRYGLGQRVMFFLAGLLVKWIVGLYYLTVRFVESPDSLAVLNRHKLVPGVRPFWHSHQLSALQHYRRVRAAVLISASRDGEYAARVARSMGFVPVRGSSSRGGAGGLKAMIRHARMGRTAAFTPDGPRGPRHAVHAGVLLCAQKVGRPIIPSALGISNFWELRSWDRFRIPKPFARGYACWGEPLPVPREADTETLKALAQTLRARMIALEKYADRCASLLAKGCSPVDLPPPD